MAYALVVVAWPWLAVALGLGLIFGSFANVCIHRLPLGQSVVSPRSRCPHCGTPIAAFDNVPVVSYLLLLGRCRKCRGRISIRYPLVEAVNGALYLALALTFDPLRALTLMPFVTALLILCLIDLDHQILPNVITLPGIVVGVLISLVPGPPSPVDSMAAALGGYVVFMWTAKFWKTFRGIDALGQGDWKMAAMLGAFLGWQKLLFTVFAAALSGTIVGLFAVLFMKRGLQHRLPFGTFLGFAGILAVFAGDPLWAWYRQFLVP